MDIEKEEKQFQDWIRLPDGTFSHEALLLWNNNHPNSPRYGVMLYDPKYDIILKNKIEQRELEFMVSCL